MAANVPFLVLSITFARILREKIADDTLHVRVFHDYIHERFFEFLEVNNVDSWFEIIFTNGFLDIRNGFDNVFIAFAFIYVDSGWFLLGKRKRVLPDNHKLNEYFKINVWYISKNINKFLKLHL